MHTLRCVTEAKCVKFPSDHIMLLYMLFWCTEMCATVYDLHLFIWQTLLSKVPHSMFLANQTFDLGVVSAML